MKKEKYSIYEAKAKLSEIISKVRKNRRIVITYRGVEVAEIVPTCGQPEDLHARLDRMESEGSIIYSGGTLDALAPMVSRPGALKRFLEEREG